MLSRQNLKKTEKSLNQQAKQILIDLTAPVLSFYWDQRKKRHVADYGTHKLVMDF